MYHPFRAAFAELCKQAARWTWEPRRADVKAPESWIEMADGSGGLFYYCFVTKAREFGMPSLSLQTTLGLPLGLTANAQAERMQHRFTKRMAKRLFSDSQLTAMKYNMELEQRSKARRAALALHEPLPVAQIAYVSQYLGVDSVVQPHLVWVASAALCDMLSPALPAGWEKVKPKADPYARSHKLPHYYHNMLLGAVQWEHPALTYWRSLLYDLLALEPAHVAGEAPPAGVHHCGPPRGRGPTGRSGTPRERHIRLRAAAGLGHGLGHLAQARPLPAGLTCLVFHAGLAAQAQHLDHRRR